MNTPCGGRKVISIVLIGAALLAFTNLGAVYLFDVDEAVFAQASKEMLLSGDWINPTYNGINRYDKPILIYWLIIVSYKVFGVNEFAARAPSVLSGLLLLYVLHRFAQQHISEGAACFAIIAFAFSPYFFVYSRAAVTDMTLTLFITLSLISFYSGSRLKNAIGLYAFSALAFLTKGLIGVVFPFAIALIYIVFTRQWQRLRIVFSPLGIAVFVVIAAPWYVAQYHRNGMEFVEQFFLKHHFRRYTDVISGHSGPIYYYLLAIFSGLLPWSFLLPTAISRAWRERQGVLGFALLWLVFVIVFFSLSTTKLPNYILPSVPAAVLLLGSVNEKTRAKGFKLTVAISSLVFSAMLVLVMVQGLAVQYGITETHWLYWIVLLNICTFLLMLLPERYFSVSLMPKGLAFLMFLLLLIIALKGLPIVSERLQGTLYKFSVYAKEHLKTNERVFIYKINQPSIVFYSDRRVVRAGSYEEAEAIIKSSPVRLAITKMRHQSELIQLGFRLKEAGQDYGLFER